MNTEDILAENSTDSLHVRNVRPCTGNGRRWSIFLDGPDTSGQVRDNISCIACDASYLIPIIIEYNASNEPHGALPEWIFIATVGDNDGVSARATESSQLHIRTASVTPSHSKHYVRGTTRGVVRNEGKEKGMMTWVSESGMRADSA